MHVCRRSREQRTANPAGFTRKYTERDQLTSSSVGGIGAEGNVAIPEGVVFRLKKGRYLAIQAHYLNVSDRDIKGETYIDIKMTPRNEANTVAGHFATTSVAISLPPKVQTTLDVHCDVKVDLHVLRMTNHMHYAGRLGARSTRSAPGTTRRTRR